MALAEELELPVEAGIALRVVGQASLAAGEHEAAMTSFERSLPLLADHDPYESARSQAQWGQMLLAGSDASRGIDLLHKARATFAKLGAGCDLAAVDTNLQS